MALNRVFCEPEKFLDFNHAITYLPDMKSSLAVGAAVVLARASGITAAMGAEGLSFGKGVGPMASMLMQNAGATKEAVDGALPAMETAHSELVDRLGPAGATHALASFSQRTVDGFERSGVTQVGSLAADPGMQVDRSDRQPSVDRTI